MFELTTQRLRLIPLSHQQLLTLSQSREALERQLDLEPSGLELEDDGFFMGLFDQALREWIVPNVERHPGNYYLYTHWVIVHRSMPRIIGGIGASVLPGEAGEVMIGYFIDHRFKGQNMATEAAGSFVQWLFTQPGIRSVIADTLADHVASQRVLQKCGFGFHGEVEEGYRWKVKA